MRELRRLVLLFVKEVGSARLRESDIHPISPKTPSPVKVFGDWIKRNKTDYNFY